MALALLLGSFHAEAGTVPKSPDGFVDVSRFDEAERAFIFKSAENMLYDSISDISDDFLGKKDGQRRLKELMALCYTMLAVEVGHGGVEPLARLYGFRVNNLVDNINGVTDMDTVESIEGKIEAEKQKYFDSLMQRYADKKFTTASLQEMQDIARQIGKDIFATAMEKMADDK